MSISIAADTVAGDETAVPTAIALSALPPLGAEFAGGTFVGLTTKPDGTHHAVVLLPDAPANRMAWQAAMDWATGVGGELPARPVAALLFANARSHFERAWYWTNETLEDDGAYAWTQLFSYGYQGHDRKSYEGRARAVRLIHLGT
jgi:hypothetical protein